MRQEKGQGKPVQRYSKQAQQTKVNFHTYTRLQSLYASIQLSAFCFCVKNWILYGQIEYELHRSGNGAIQSASLLIIVTFRCLFEKIYFAFGRATWLSSWEPTSADYPIELSSLKNWGGHRLTVIEKFEEAQPHLGKLLEDFPRQRFLEILSISRRLHEKLDEIRWQRRTKSFLKPLSMWLRRKWLWGFGGAWIEELKADFMAIIVGVLWDLLRTADSWEGLAPQSLVIHNKLFP